MKRFLAFLLSAIALPLTASAAGFALEDGSVRGNVTPGELAAKGGVPSAQYFNPATVTELPGTQFELGATFIKPWADVKTVSPYTGTTSVGHGHSKVWSIPNAYATHQINDALFFGLGLYTRFGLGAKFPSDWAGRYNSIKAEILSFDLAPVLAWKVSDRLSLAAGIDIRYFDIELSQQIDAAGAAGLRPYNDPAPSPYDVRQTFHGDDILPAVDVGATFKVTDTVTAGLAYHSRIKYHVKGDAKWEKPPAVAAMAPQFFNNCDFDAWNYNPDKVMAGVAWDATEKLTLSAGLTYTLWHLYDDLVIHVAKPELMGRDKVTSEKKWHDVFRASAGASYRISDEWGVRAGYTFDQSPINGAHTDYLVPGDDRHLFSVGADWTKGAWTVDASYFYEVVADFDVKGDPAHGTFDGKFQDASGHAVALALIRRF